MSLLSWRGTFVGLSIPVFLLGAVMWWLLGRHTGSPAATKQARGVDTGNANRAAPLGGHLSDRYGQTRIMVLVGIAVMFTKMPTAESYIAHSVPPRLRATVLGIYFFSGTEMSALLTPVIGKMVDSFGFRAAYLTIGAGMIIAATTCTMLFAWFKRRSEKPIEESVE